MIPYNVIDRMTGKVVYTASHKDAQTAHERCEKWCKENLGDRGKIAQA